MDKKAWIIQEFFKYGLEISSLQAEQFEKYFEILVDTNQHLNLTAITEFEEVVVKHFIDSALLIKYFDLPEGASLIDVGTGAGFPGLPLKIMRPDLRITLLDSLNKRLNFLNTVIETLSLKEIICVHARAEDGGQNKALREQFDYAVSRAVSQLNVLLEYCTPFIKIGGTFIAYKSKKLTEELEDSKKAFHVMGCQLKEVIPYTLGDHENVYAFIVKHQKTGKNYPRKAGTATKNPIK